MDSSCGNVPEVNCSSLDTKSICARKKRKRAYHRIMSGLKKSGNVRLITLTSAPESGDFQRDFRKLIMRLKRRGLVADYIRCPEKTKEGQRHDHVLFRGSYIEQVYLSKLWGEIHNSPVVDIRRVGGMHRIACYLGKYLSKSDSGRLSWSWGWVWKGFVKSWSVLKRYSLERGWSYKRLLTEWDWCIKLMVKPEEVLPT